jgi:hypothetical protein
MHSWARIFQKRIFPSAFTNTNARPDELTALFRL